MPVLKIASRYVLACEWLKSILRYSPTPGIPLLKRQLLNSSDPSASAHAPVDATIWTQHLTVRIGRLHTHSVDSSFFDWAKLKVSYVQILSSSYRLALCLSLTHLIRLYVHIQARPVPNRLVHRSSLCSLYKVISSHYSLVSPFRISSVLHSDDSIVHRRHERQGMGILHVSLFSWGTRCR